MREPSNRTNLRQNSFFSKRCSVRSSSDALVSGSEIAFKKRNRPQKKEEDNKHGKLVLHLLPLMKKRTLPAPAFLQKTLTRDLPLLHSCLSLLRIHQTGQSESCCPRRRAGQQCYGGFLDK